MKNRAVPYLALAASFASASVFSQPVGQAPQGPAAPAPGPAILNRSCTSCHDSGQIMQARPAADWQPIIERMRANGASLSDEDAKILLDYLIKSYSIRR